MLKLDTLALCYEVVRQLNVSAQDPEMVPKATRIQAAMRDLESAINEAQKAEQPKGLNGVAKHVAQPLPNPTPPKPKTRSRR